MIAGRPPIVCLYFGCRSRRALFWVIVIAGKGSCRVEVPIMCRRIFNLVECSLIIGLAGIVPQSSVLAVVPGAFVPTTSPHSQVMKALKAAHRLLSEADHDYRGHRHLAAEEVHKAIEELGHHHHKSAIVAGSTATGVLVPMPKNAAHSPHGKTHESQADSDSQLQQAQRVLEAALQRLGASHAKAATNVRAAIAQINVALSVR